MPIRPDLRQFYTPAAGWPAVRSRTLERAGGKFDERGKYLGGAKCEQCGKPDRESVETVTRPYGDSTAMFWRVAGTDWQGIIGGRKMFVATSHFSAPYFAGRTRIVAVVLTCAHLDHNSANNAPDNVFAWCQWCHLHHDAPQHKLTRCVRKDAARPLLQEAV